MIKTEVHSWDDFEKFFAFLKTVMIKDAERDKHLRIYSWNWSHEDVFPLVLLHFYERLGDIAKVKKAPRRKQMGLEMRGVDIQILTDDMELFRSRVNEMCNGQTKSYV